MRFLQRFVKPPDLTVSEWADEFRRLSPESSAEPGLWRTNRAEYQRGIMNAVSDPDVESVIVMASAQVGKTEIINNMIGFHIDQDPAPILLLQPTLEMGQAWSKDRFAPMLRDTPALQGKVKDPRARDSGNTLLHKTFAGGHITIAGANSPAGLASRPIRIVLCDEVDRYPVSAGSEGDPVSLATARSRTFWNRKRIMTSTPTVKGASRIESAFDESDKRYYFVTCADCGGAQRLKWAAVQWPEDDPAAAFYVCEHCGTTWDDVARWRAIRGGEWIATGEFKGVAGFHIWAAYSPWVKLGELAMEFIEAKKKPDTLRVFVNTVLGETWEDQGEKVEIEGLAGRVESYGADQIPDGVVLLTAGVDTQGDRLEVELIGWGRDEETWTIEHRIFAGDPDSSELWAELDEYLKTSFPVEGRGPLRIEAVAIDSGGHSTQAVYKFCAARKRRRVWAIKGVSGAGKLVWPKRASRVKSGMGQLFIVGVDSAKEVIHGRLKRVEEPGPGYFHFNAECDDEYFAQLTAEQVRTKYVKGFPRREWFKTRSRNEVFDCVIYAYAAMVGRAVDLNRRANRFEKAEKVEAGGLAPEPAKADAVGATPTLRRRARPKQRGGFVNAWR